VIAGDSGVGKTSIFWRFIEDNIPDTNENKVINHLNFR